ncbi:uncharacterized protein LODBEIA_P45470 [Lodderomyces beijingensis]|uniref:Mmc1 C-terminal domain-containing protein n=1 Tax=Lodderomyces beijingensis TaxID=1775926 RepID=A0ABP0ZRL2_9ASCO
MLATCLFQSGGSIGKNGLGCAVLRLKIQARGFARTRSVCKEHETLTWNLNNYQSTFPQDALVNGQISTLKKLLANRHHPQALKCGIIYESAKIRQQSKVVEVLLADPLASNNKTWFEKILHRDGRARYSFAEEELVADRRDFKVPSPILSGVYRSRYGDLSDTSQNDIVLVEEVDPRNLGSTVEEFTYFVYVTNRFESASSSLPQAVRDRILVEVIDNVEYSPASTESTPLTIDKSLRTHVVKIDSEKALEGILAFLKDDVKATDLFIDNMSSSNVYELFKIIDFYSRTNSALKWYLNGIIEDIQNKIKRDTANAAETSTQVQGELTNFIQFVNSELQYEFEPKTRRFIHKNLAWWKLYYKNDNVEYDLKDYFNVNFMPKSIEIYNFLRGKMMPNEKAVHNPLLTLKNEVINQRVGTEVQPEVLLILSKAFVYYQLPISLLAGLAYQFFDFSANASVALFSLGWVVGFNYVSRNWIKFMDSWLHGLVETIRICLSKSCIEDGLLKESKAYVETAETANTKRQALLKEIEAYEGKI